MRIVLLAPFILNLASDTEVTPKPTFPDESILSFSVPFVCT